MSKAHYEYTGETKEIVGVTVKQIRATRYLSRAGVRSDDIGGWIQKRANLSGLAWVGPDAVVMGDARVSGKALILDSAQVMNSAEVTDRAVVRGSAYIQGSAVIADSASIRDDTIVSGHARVFGDSVVAGGAHVYMDAIVSGGARIFGPWSIGAGVYIQRPDHLLIVGPIGSEGVHAVLCRTTTGHRLDVGCWFDGRVESLAAEVERRASRWDASPERAAVWRAQYVALEALCRATIDGWALDK